jgi:hypothetical protein
MLCFMKIPNQHQREASMCLLCKSSHACATVPSCHNHGGALLHFYRLHSNQVVGNVALVTHCITSQRRPQSTKQREDAPNELYLFYLTVPALAKEFYRRSRLSGSAPPAHFSAPASACARSYFLAEKRLVQEKLSRHL